MKLPGILITVAACAILSSCVGSKELYSWSDYENRAYQYSKTPNDETAEKLMQTYNKMIAHPGGQRKTVPPGIYAESGYIFFKNGKKEEAIKCFQTEMEIYPESALFMNRIIDSLK